jgi:serine phosphatase RsbU (regulator of sigma subunit)
MGEYICFYTIPTFKISKNIKKLIFLFFSFCIISNYISAQIKGNNTQFSKIYQTKLDTNQLLVKEALLQKSTPQNISELQKLYKHIAETAEEKGDFKEAFYYHKLFRELSDSLYAAETARLKQELLINTETPQEIANNNKELILQTQIRNLFIFFSLLILIIAFFLYRINLQRAKANGRLVEQNTEMLQQKKKITESQKAIEKKNRLLELQNYEITLKNREIQTQNQDVKDSIEYAQRIQAAMLPSSETIQRILQEYFVLLKPKDIVSGDFYWLHQEEDKIIVAAIDCTGHGVPGAFMSLIAKQLLDDIIIQHNMTEPADILNALHQKIRLALNQAESNNKDGMDMTLCLIDKKKRTLTFAGAYNPMVVIQNGEIDIIKGDSFPIGGWHFQGSKRAFSQQEVSLLPDTDAMIYLYSDGYQDQFGGEEDRKFMKSRFRKLLLSIHQKPMAEQEDILNKTIENWKGSNTQVDDILVIGVRLQAKDNFV